MDATVSQVFRDPVAGRVGGLLSEKVLSVSQIGFPDRFSCSVPIASGAGLRRG